jgi:hypothetical protein
MRSLALCCEQEKMVFQHLAGQLAEKQRPYGKQREGGEESAQGMPARGGGGGFLGQTVHDGFQNLK